MSRVREKRTLGGGTRESELELIEQADEALTEIKELAEEGVPILVEGKRDAEALKRLGVKGTIL